MMPARTAALFGALVLALLCAGATAKAQSGVVPLGSHPTADDLIRALTAKPGVTRGIVVKSSNPASADAQPAAAPTVALDVKFALNSAVLSPEAKDLIKQIAIAMNSEQLARARFRVEGHTDTTGTPDYNMALSRQRAEAVRDELAVQYGIKPSRLQTVGRGQENLLDAAHPTSPDNRRVVIVNLGE